MLLVLVVSILGISYVLLLSMKILDSSPGNEKTIQLSEIIQKGARSFLLHEYQVFLPFVVALSLILGFLLGWNIAGAFFVGALLSTLSGFFGMTIATKANARTSWAARHGLGKALKIAFSGGAVMGLTVSSLGLLGLVFVYAFTKDASKVSYYSLGASFVALFARVGGGIFTKAADVGADIVGKTEANLPEDDPRNPAVIADNVGDNVGDVAGMGADLFESYVGSIFSTLLGFIQFSSKTSVRPYDCRYPYYHCHYTMSSYGKVNLSCALTFGTQMCSPSGPMFFCPAERAVQNEKVAFCIPHEPLESADHLVYLRCDEHEVALGYPLEEWVKLQLDLVGRF